MKKRVFICEFTHENNSFNPGRTELDDFRAIRFSEGRETYDLCKALPCAFRGMIDAVEEVGGEVIPSVSLFGCAGARVSDETVEYVKEHIARDIRAAGKLDAVFCSLHGATVSESEYDVCGHLLTFIRSLVGPEMLIAASFDLHANMTDTILQQADVITGYQTYPHMDFYETGYRAGKMAMEKLAGKKIVTAAVHVPVLTPPSGYTSAAEPFKGVLDEGHAACAAGDILDFSLFNVQPWMDLPVVSSTVVVAAETEEAACRRCESIARHFFAVRDGLWPELLDIDAVIDMAEDPSLPKPIVLGDAADSPNGGAVGDSVFHAMRVMERGSRISMCLFVKDPEAVAQAFRIGVGGSADFSVGGKFTPDMPGPLRGTARVRSLHDGDFILEGPAQRGSFANIGRSAVLSFGRIDVLVCEAPTESGDPQILRHFGLEPTLYDLVVVKANTSFRVPYGKFAGRIVYGDTPGACAANLHRFHWKNLPKGMYPFDLPADYEVEKARIYR